MAGFAGPPIAVSFVGSLDMSRTGVLDEVEKERSAPAERPDLGHANGYIAALAMAGILLHLLLRYAAGAPRLAWMIPLWATLAVGGIPLVWGLAQRLFHREFGSDLLAGISIITAWLLGDYLVASIVILMLSGGTALEEAATRRASSVLRAL